MNHVLQPGDNVYGELRALMLKYKGQDLFEHVLTFLAHNRENIAPQEMIHEVLPYLDEALPKEPREWPRQVWFIPEEAQDPLYSLVRKVSLYTFPPHILPALKHLQQLEHLAFQSVSLTSDTIDQVIAATEGKGLKKLALSWVASKSNTRLPLLDEPWPTNSGGRFEDLELLRLWGSAWGGSALRQFIEEKIGPHLNTLSLMPRGQDLGEFFAHPCSRPITTLSLHLRYQPKRDDLFLSLLSWPSFSRVKELRILVPDSAIEELRAFFTNPGIGGLQCVDLPGASPRVIAMLQRESLLSPGTLVRYGTHKEFSLQI